jgi:septal ring factor EnvC (AmiA/AmiB activator)
MRRRTLAFSVLLLALAGSGPRAQQPDERARTEALSQRAAARLQALYDEADRLAREERSLLGDLRRLELERAIRATELDAARANVRAAGQELTSLDQQVSALSAQAQAALPDLQARLVTLYKLGRGQYARLLLSASDLRQFGQAVRLVSALAEQDRQRIADHQRRLASLQAARAAAAERQQHVQRAQADAQRAQAAAEKAIAAHSALVDEIDTKRELNAQFASELQSAQQKLQDSLSGLAATSPTLPLLPFRGDLDWPSAGTVRQRFGAAAAGRPPLRGIEIAGPAGADVKAVHDGTVAFADVFTGYGRLVVVDHGNQTFTLYGNLDEVSVEKGAHVERGTRLGSAASGEPGTAVLYFELRVDGRAVDPLQWLAKR